MDLLEQTTSTNERSMETATSNEDVLVVLQTENGEQIALPMSALPSDFVPGESGQIIMVESAMDDQHQEVVVESSDIIDTQQSNSENFVSLQQAETDTFTTISQINPTIEPNDSIVQNLKDILNGGNEATIVHQNIQPLAGDRTTPRTYSKSNVNKSHISNQITESRISSNSERVDQVLLHNNQEKPLDANHGSNTLNDREADSNAPIEMEIETKNVVNNADEAMTKSQQDILSEITDVEQKPANEVILTIPRVKQKRKEPLVTRELSEEDKKLEFQIIEDPSPSIPETEVKRRPRKEYKTKKKVRLALEKLTKEEAMDSSKDEDSVITESPITPQDEEIQKDDEVEKESPKNHKSEFKHLREPRQSKSEATKRFKLDTKHPESQSKQRTKHQPDQSPPHSGRRTRLSNSCRVATGKSYKCNDCDFSTDRINNIVLHMKESCPRLRSR